MCARESAPLIQSGHYTRPGAPHQPLQGKVAAHVQFAVTGWRRNLSFISLVITGTSSGAVSGSQTVYSELLTLHPCDLRAAALHHLSPGADTLETAPLASQFERVLRLSDMGGLHLCGQTKILAGLLLLDSLKAAAHSCNPGTKGL